LWDLVKTELFLDAVSYCNLQ